MLISSMVYLVYNRRKGTVSASFLIHHVEKLLEIDHAIAIEVNCQGERDCVWWQSVDSKRKKQLCENGNGMLFIDMFTLYLSLFNCNCNKLFTNLTPSFMRLLTLASSGVSPISVNTSASSSLSIAPELSLS